MVRIFLLLSSAILLIRIGGSRSSNILPARKSNHEKKVEISSDFNELDKLQQIRSKDIVRHLQSHEGEDDIESRAQAQGLFPTLFDYFKNTFSGNAKPQIQSTTAYGPSEIIFDFEDMATLGSVVDDIEDGIKGTVHLTEGGGRNPKLTSGNSSTDGRRGLPVYLFQGQYLAEPRLNRFIDGAMDNLGQEIMTSSLDPIYFRVLPRGRVVGRPKPLRRFPAAVAKPVRRKRRRPIRRIRRRRRRPLLFGRRRRHLRSIPGDETSRQNQGLNRRRNQQKKQGMAQQRGVGGGRVDGLSKISRDGDAEMQLFGNYTLIRSHYNVGPVNLIMQFRTIRGMRRADATLERIKVHTVTRVNTQGCEMIDFLLDRPHAETIEIRSELFPLASRIAKTIFSRLFADDSFLVARMKEKTALALLSKKASF